MSSRLTRRSLWKWLMFLGLALWAAASLLPVAASLLDSLKSTDSIVASPLGIPTHPAFGNFAQAWRGPSLGLPLWHYAINSAIAVSIGVSVGVSIGTIAGYALARQAEKLSWLNRYFVLLLTLPGVVTWVPLFSIASDLNILSNPAGLGFIYAALVTPLSTVLLRTYFGSFPLDLIDAAKVEGASEVRAFTRIVIRMSKGTIGMVALLQAIMLWNELALAVILLLQSSSQTIPVGLTQFRSEFALDLGPQFAGIVIAIVPMILLYFVTSRRVAEGMRLGTLR